MFKTWVEASFHQPLTITPVGGFTFGGETIEGESATVLGRIEPEARLLVGRDGQDHVVAARLFVPAGAAITQSSLVLYEGRRYVALQGGPLVDLDGHTTHQEWLLGDG